MRNSERFLLAFNSIEKHLGKKRNTHGYVPFYKAVEVAKKGDAVVRRYQDDLLEFADLRNAIVHERTDPNFVIAEPHESTVLKIESIEMELGNPKTVFQTFRSDVFTFQVNNSLSDVLKVIRDRRYSQFPVYNDNEFVGIISENGITNWLAKNIEEDIISLVETPLELIIQCEENKNNYQFINRNTSVYKVEEIFKERLSIGTKLDAILITQNGRKNESLLGIITPWDIIKNP